MPSLASIPLLLITDNKGGPTHGQKIKSQFCSTEVGTSCFTIFDKDVSGYMKGCHICQLSRNDKPPTIQLQTRINLNYWSLYRLSMNLKVVPRSYKSHKYILHIIDEVTNYLIMVPIHQPGLKEMGDALTEKVISKFYVPDYIIMDQDSAFMSSLMNYLFKKLDIKIKTVASYNHQLLQAEHENRPLSTILNKHLTNLGQIWPKYLPIATFAYNTFNAPNMANYSPYDLVFGRKPKLLLNLETMCDIKVLELLKIFTIC